MMFAWSRLNVEIAFLTIKREEMGGLGPIIVSQK